MTPIEVCRQIIGKYEQGIFEPNALREAMWRERLAMHEAIERAQIATRAAAAADVLAATADGEPKP